MLTRRAFVVIASSAAAGVALLPPHATAAGGSAGYRCLNAAAAAFIEAACECFIPATPASPGATAAGVTAYIDTQLLSPWGQGCCERRASSWQAGTPIIKRPGMTPARYFQTAACAVQRRSDSAPAFERLAPPLQCRLLESWSLRSLDLDGVPSHEFMDALLMLAVEGYFSQPRFALTRDRIAWPMQAFPGGHAAVSGQVG
jgi:gluconate 2-dehydrogenase gamma chain